MAVLTTIKDGLRNLAVGMGAANRDKFAGAAYFSADMDPEAIRSAYEGSWIASKAVDIPADDATRAWRSWQASPEQIELLEAEEKRLGLSAKVNEAIKLARLWGGSGILFSDGGDPSEPLDTDRVGKGGLRYAHVLTRFDLSAGELEQSVESDNFGRPAYYRLNVGSQVSVNVHPSRVALFYGPSRAKRGALTQTDYWGLSIIQRVHEAAKAADSTHLNIASLIFEAKVDVINVPNLSQHLQTAEGEQRLKERFSTASLIKGINGTLILDGEETHSSKSASFNTLPDILAMMLQITSGAVDIPAPRFMAQSPGGLNASGDADIRNYYDMISAMQQNTVSPAMKMLDECLIRSALGVRPPEVHYIWSSLWQMSEKERAEIRDRNASSASKLVDAGIYPPEVVENMHTGAAIEAGLYPGLEAAIEDYDGEMKALFGEETGDDTSVTDARPMTLYVQRKVLNADDILKWARGQGLADTLSADDLHVTIAYSRSPMDWIAVGEPWDDEITIKEGGPRIMEVFGENALVLQFASHQLNWRHQEMRRAGASWDWPEYQPHISISYGTQAVDLKDIEPYQGPIVLGPELFSEVDENWKKRVAA